MDRLKIAWIGTGVMGAPMAAHLLDGGHSLKVHNRTKSKAEILLDRGATWAEDPAGAAEGADIAFSMVSYPEDVEATHLGVRGTLQASRPPHIIVDMTSSRPSLAKEIYAAARARNVGSVDAPVSGSDIGARNATLSIMIGGDDREVAVTRPLFELMGKQIVHQGGPGAGQHTKMVNQILLLNSMMGVCEGLLYAFKAGLDPLRVIDSVGAGAAGSWAITNLGPKIIARDFAPGFFFEHFLKDLGIALEEAERMGLALPGVALGREFYRAVRAEGYRDLGIHALTLALERLNGLDSQRVGSD